MAYKLVSGSRPLSGAVSAALVSVLAISLYSCTLVGISSIRCRPVDASIEFLGVKSRFYVGNCEVPK